MVDATFPPMHAIGGAPSWVDCMVFLKVLMTQHRPTCRASLESSLRSGDHAVCSKEPTPTRLHVPSPRRHNYGASDQTFCIYARRSPASAKLAGLSFCCSVLFLASAHEPVRQLIETPESAPRRPAPPPGRHKSYAARCESRRAAAGTNRPRRHVLRQLVARRLQLAMIHHRRHRGCRATSRVLTLMRAQ